MDTHSHMPPVPQQSNHHSQPSASPNGPVSPQAAGGLPLTFEQYLAQTITQLTTMAGNLQVVLEAVQQGRTNASLDLCTLLHCPRATAYEAGIRHTIEVLRQTKNAFKSKTLGMLRERLEALLQEDTGAAESCPALHPCGRGTSETAVLSTLTPVLSLAPGQVATDTCD